MIAIKRSTQDKLQELRADAAATVDRKGAMALSSQAQHSSEVRGAFDVLCYHVRASMSAERAFETCQRWQVDLGLIIRRVDDLLAFQQLRTHVSAVAVGFG